jgi:hypothetical protein
MDSLSRDPSDYRPDPDGHFRRRLDERDIPPVVIQKAIEGGDVVEQDNGHVKLTTTYLGYDFAVVVNPERGYAITAYSEDDWHQ